VLRDYLSGRVVGRLGKVTGDPATFLREYVNEWKKYSLFVFSNKKMFDYLDKFYLKTNSQLSLSDQALEVFREIVFKPHLYTLRRSILD
jgi:hypothetical protein